MTPHASQTIEKRFLLSLALTGDPRFAVAVGQVWNFIETHLIDRVHGDWFKETDRAGQVNPAHLKADFWDCPYHHARACLEIIERLSAHEREAP